jgi:Esterase-like activity of phytase
VIVFEDGPAIGRFSPRGEFIKEIALPPLLADPDAYSSANKRLESVSELSGLGIITAPEARLAKEPEDIHSISTMDGKAWRFLAFQAQQSSLKAMDPLPDGRILVLERTRDPETDAPQAHLRIVDIAHCDPAAICPVVEVVVSDDAAIADDFEGMTRIGPDLYLIVTDAPHGGRMALFRLRN